MKRVMSTVFILLLIVLPLSLSVSASGNGSEEQILGDHEVVYFEDGSYAIVTISEDPVLSDSQSSTKAAQTKSGSKSISFYSSNNVIQWTVTVSGTFSYDGSSATCTASSVSSVIYVNDWKVTSAVASKSGNKAIGDFTVKRYVLLIPVQTETVKLTLACSASGALS